MSPRTFAVLVLAATACHRSSELPRCTETVTCRGGGSDLDQCDRDAPDGCWGWIRQLDTGTDDVSDGAAFDASGNLHVLGTTFGEVLGQKSAGRVDVFVATFGPDGEPVRARHLGTPDDDFAKAVAASPGGEVFVAYDTTSKKGRGAIPAALARLDAAGNLAWTKATHDRHHDGILSLAADAEGGVVAGGIYYGELDGKPYEKHDGFVARFDAAGNETWRAPLQGSVRDEITCVAVEPSGDIDAGGNGRLDNRIDGNTVNTAFVQRLERDGRRRWLTPLPEATFTEAVAPDGAGGLFATGVSFGQGEARTVHLYRLDAGGRILWSKPLGPRGKNEVRGLARSPAGGAYLGLNHEDLKPDGRVTGFAHASVLAVDGSGDVLWEHPYRTDKPDRIRGLAVDANGRVGLAGSTNGRFAPEATAAFKDAFVSFL